MVCMLACILKFQYTKAECCPRTILRQTVSWWLGTKHSLHSFNAFFGFPVAIGKCFKKKQGVRVFYEYCWSSAGPRGRDSFSCTPLTQATAMLRHCIRATSMKFGRLRSLNMIHASMTAITARSERNLFVRNRFAYAPFYACAIRNEGSVQTQKDDIKGEKIPGTQLGGPKMAIVFTCVKCGTRSARQFSKVILLARWQSQLWVRHGLWVESGVIRPNYAPYQLILP